MLWPLTGAYRLDVCVHNRWMNCPTCGWQDYETERELRVDQDDLLSWMRRKNPDAYMHLLD